MSRITVVVHIELFCGVLVVKVSVNEKVVFIDVRGYLLPPGLAAAYFPHFVAHF